MFFIGLLVLFNFYEISLLLGTIRDLISEPLIWIYTLTRGLSASHEHDARSHSITEAGHATISSTAHRTTYCTVLYMVLYL